ncbi:hypothetical protein LAC81_25390 [Ensifer adhaerens]|uniref:hypothetical protein n=1 Tax=Ensifer adhaerens TaxID=106592 RepID=UPI003AF3915C|nr:hypothetical protein LAC78_23095 [Ensifer adhaerens]UAY03991.1 hypothetical protein LAC80_21865 [Ensifer adhaerens]UAY11977.1 hypothetical protein LAC81_25390 [Ensifer adhaerens]
MGGDVLDQREHAIAVKRYVDDNIVPAATLKKPSARIWTCGHRLSMMMMSAQDWVGRTRSQKLHDIDATSLNCRRTLFLPPVGALLSSRESMKRARIDWLASK